MTVSRDQQCSGVRRVVRFDALPIARRADAFEANDEGWSLMVQLVEKYLLPPKS